MKMIIVALALVAAVAALPVENELIKIIRSEFDQSPEGSYNYGFDTENGIHREEVGEVKEALDEENKPHKVVTVRGSYSWVNEEGKTETVNYYADESGFHAEGDSIPKPVQSRR